MNIEIELLRGDITPRNSVALRIIMEADCIHKCGTLFRTNYHELDTVASWYIASQQFYFNIQDFRSGFQHRNADKLDLEALYLR